jgi:HEAT repeat protein
VGFREWLFGPTEILKLKERRDVQGLQQALAHASPFRRREAAEALKESKDPATLASLGQALLDQDRKRPLRYLQTVSNSQGWIDTTLQLEWTRFKVATTQAIAGIGGDEAADLLTQALSDPVPKVRSEAAGSLGKLGETRAVPALIRALQDEDEWVRINAAGALGLLRDPVAIGPLVNAAEGDTDRVVRVKAIFALQRIMFDRQHHPQALSGESADAIVAMARGPRCLPAPPPLLRDRVEGYSKREATRKPNPGTADDSNAWPPASVTSVR